MGFTELQTGVEKMFQGGYKKNSILKTNLGDHIQLRTISHLTMNINCSDFTEVLQFYLHFNGMQ